MDTIAAMPYGIYHVPLPSNGMELCYFSVLL